MRRHALVADSQRDVGFDAKPAVIVSEIRGQRPTQFGSRFYSTDCMAGLSYCAYNGQCSLRRV